jgi:membrane protease YdiL (CAAX protease family)
MSNEFDDSSSPNEAVGANPPLPPMPPMAPPVQRASNAPRIYPPFWTVIVGIGLFLSLQVVVGIIAVGFVFSQNPDSLTSDPDSLVTPLMESGAFIIAGLVTGWIGLLSGVWLGGRRVAGGWRAAVRWGVKWKRDIAIAIAFTVGLRLVEWVAGMGLEAVGVNVSELGNTGFLSAFSGVWLIAVVVGAVLGAPLVEELFFRGLLLRSIQGKWGAVAGVVISSLVFGLFHVQATAASSLYTVVSTAITGAALAVLVLRTNRLGTSILSHVLFNGTGVALALLITS